MCFIHCYYAHPETRTTARLSKFSSWMKTFWNENILDFNSEASASLEEVITPLTGTFPLYSENTK